MSALVRHLRRSVATRLFATIIVAFLGVASVISLGLIVEVWLRAQSDLDREFEFLRSAFHDPLADYVWALDLQGLAGVVDGMIRLPLINGVLITDPATGRVLAEAGDQGTHHHLVGFTFALRHDYAGFGEGQDIVAWATIYRPSNAVLDRAWPSIALILVAALVKIFLLFALFYVFSRRILQRPLMRLAEGVDRLSRNLDDPRPLDVAADTGVELEQVEAAVNRLVAALGEKQRERDSYAAALEAARDELEARVEQRTLELQDALLSAEDASQAKSRFLAMISHELRTPLNAVLGFSELIRDSHFGPIDDRYRSYAGDVNSAGQHLLQIINDMLDVTRIEAGRMSISPDRLDVADLVRSVRRLLGDRPRERGIALDVEQHGVRYLWADETAARQMLLNLIGNALKFTDRGGAILIAFRAVDGGVALSVSDTGVGMDEDQAEQARLLFVQIGSRRRSDGLGLGLPIVEGLIRLHGGTMEIDSAPQQGTTVTLFFPDRPEAGQAGEGSPR